MLQAYNINIYFFFLVWSCWGLVSLSKKMEEKKVSKLNAVYCEGGTKVILITKIAQPTKNKCTEKIYSEN